MYSNVLAISTEHSLSKQFLEIKLIICFEKEYNCSGSWSVMWTNDNVYYNRGSFFVSSALFFAIENSQKMFSASVSHIISVAIFIKPLLSFGFILCIYKDLKYRNFLFVPLNQQCFCWSIHPHSLLTQSHDQ